MRRLRQLLHWEDLEDKDATNQEPPEHPSIDPPVPYLPVPNKPLEITRQTGSAFFDLPPEIRRRVLADAFGGRTIHVDFRLRRPLYTESTSRGWPLGHAGYPPMFQCATDDLPILIPPGNRAWRWFSCICHRLPPSGSPLAILRDPGPHTDKCLEGRAECQSWPGGFPDKCTVIGAIGFLLSCKQGYDEGSEILYSKNSFFIESQPLIEAILQQTLLPETSRVMSPSIRFVTSLDLRWTAILFSDNAGYDVTAERTRLIESLELLPRTFPRLMRLHLIFERYLYVQWLPSAEDKLAALETVLLKPVLEVSNKLPLLKDFSIALPDAVFWNLMISLKVPPRPKDVGVSHEGGEGDLMAWYPFHSDAKQERGRPGTGFWIKSGVFAAVKWRVDRMPGH